VIRTGRYNESPWDKTMWYAFEDEEKMLKGGMTKGVRRQMKPKEVG